MSIFIHIPVDTRDCASCDPEDTKAVYRDVAFNLRARADCVISKEATFNLRTRVSCDSIPKARVQQDPQPSTHAPAQVATFS